MILEKNKVIVLGNKEKYIILEEIEKNNKNYYYVAEVNEDNKDIKDNYKIVTIYERDNKQFIDEVTGKNNLKEILPLFTEKMNK